MEFELSADERALKEAARMLLAEVASRERVRAVVEAGSGFDPDLWRALVEQGWPAVDVPAARSGLELGAVAAAVLAEELGRAVAPAPYVSAVLAAQVAVAVGAEWLGPLLAGELVAAAGYGDEPVVDAPHAQVVVRVTSDGVWVGRVEGAGPRAEPAMDRTRAVAWVDDLGEQVGDAALAAAVLDRAAVLYAAEMLGAAERMLEAATAYAKVREQFGRPIGSFQAVKHRLADMLVDVEGMRSAAYYAAWAVGADAPDRSLAASIAKSWCADAAERVVRGALQVHGGIGFTWEHDLHLYLKRVHLSGLLFGDASFHRRRLARLLRERVDAGVDLF